MAYPIQLTAPRAPSKEVHSLMSSSSSAADAPGRAEPGSEPATEPAVPSGQEGGPAAHPGAGGSGDGAVSSRTRRRRLVRNVTALAVAAAAVAGAIVAFAGHQAPAPAGGGAARPAALADEPAATVAVVKTNGTIIGGPVLSKDGQMWLVEVSRVTGKPMLTVVNPVTYAVSTYPLPTTLGGVSLRYTGAEAFDIVGLQLWLGAKAAAPGGQQPADVVVRYIPAAGAFAQFSLGGNCSDEPAAQPPQLYAGSDGGIWAECAASQNSGATFIARLAKDGTFTLPVITNTLNRALLGTPLWDEIANLPQAKIGPLAPAPGGAMWGVTTGGFVQIATTGAEVFTSAGPDAVELVTQAPATIGSLQLVGNGAAAAVGGLGECRAADAQAGQAQECAVAVDSYGELAMVAAAPDYDGHAGLATVHPAGMDASGDVWFIVDGTDGGRAPQGQYFYEATPGGGTRVVPFSVPGDALPVPVVRAPVITTNGGVWTLDPESGPGTLVEVMPKNS